VTAQRRINTTAGLVIKHFGERLESAILLPTCYLADGVVNAF
jgi:hypothetical protein